MRAGSGRGDDLCVRAGLPQRLLAVVNVAMAGHGNVVVTGIVQAGIALVIMRNSYRAGALLQRLDVFGRIVMVVEINDRHPPCLPWNVDATTQSTREAQGESSRARWRCRADWPRSG